MPVINAPKKEDIPVREDNRTDIKLMEPGKYEITGDTVFNVDIYTKENKGRYILMNGPGEGVDENNVVFRMWTFQEMIDMRKMATSYDSAKKVHMIDNDVLNRLKIQKLMKSWTFSRNNDRLKIQHVNGVMTDESWMAFTRLQPNIASYIIDRMNEVYEFNG